MPDPQLPPPTAPAPRQTTGPFVLVADADHRRAALYRDLIEARGFRALVTRNGDAAKAMLQRRDLPILLVVNLSLPRIDGFSLMGELRRVAGPDAPAVLVISSSKDLAAAALNLKDRLGISEVVPGDAPPADVRALLDRLLPGGDTEAPAPPGPWKQHAAASDRWVAETLDRFVADVARRFDVQLSFVSVMVGGHEWFRVHVNPVARTVAAGASPRSWAYVRQVAECGEPLVVPDVTQHPLFAFEAVPPPGTFRGYAGVPVRAERGTVEGALCLFDSEPLTLDARGIDSLAETGRRLALELEAGIERVQGHERYTALTRLALTDPVTGLANRRGGEAALAREVARARRSGSPLSVALFDIDQFKAVNDRAGHAVGDLVLSGVSEILSASQRGSDLAIRWGGEEFLVLLPDVGAAGAKTFAERVRENVQGLAVREAGRITVSAGVAELRKDEDTATTLARADAALYRAKGAGRNRVVCDDDPLRSPPAWFDGDDRRGTSAS